MRKNYFTIAFISALILCLLCVFILSACDNKKYFYSTQFEVSASANTNNPMRGFRGEMRVFLDRYSFDYDGSGDAEQEFDNELAVYAPEDGVRMMQLYIYLTDYYDRDLDEKAFSQLTDVFEYMRDHNLQVLLRFAYEWFENGGADNRGPTSERIIAHCRQLKGWITENETLFREVVYSVQLGMMGVWGEAHQSAHGTENDCTEIMEAVADMIPEPYQIQARYYWMLEKIPESLSHRFALHEDYLLGKNHIYDYFTYYNLTGGDKLRAEVYERFSTTVNDGEMPWGTDPNSLNVDPLQLCKQIADYSLTSMSLKHCYLEYGGQYHLYDYKSRYFTKQQLDEDGLPYLEAYLTDGRITVFDYIKNHLGYVLTLDKIEITDDAALIYITNHGFGPPAYLDLQYYSGGKLISSGYDMSSLRGGSSAVIRLEGVRSLDGLKLASLTNPDRYALFATDLTVENGIQTFELNK